MPKGIVTYVRNPLYWLLLGLPLALLLVALSVPPQWILLASAVALIPLASLIGESTEALAAHTGPRVGGLLNATLGNAAELIISIVAIREGLLELVKASITGSILGNLLLVLGLSMLAGGMRHGVLSFDRRKAMSDSIMLVLAVLALGVPSLFTQATAGIASPMHIEVLSLGVALLMIVIYVMGLIYSFRRMPSPFTRPSTETVIGDGHWSLRTSLIVLGVAVAGTVWMSELLVRQVEPVVIGLGISEFFLGVILVPIVGNVAEHLVAVTVAMKNRMTLSVEIAVGSSLQIALFVAPLLVFLSLLMGNPLTLVFNRFELIALAGGVLVAALVSSDGEANWFEGAELLAVYLMFALAFFFLPS
ncbi:MAG: calcium/proton exchanger [Anaerolineales bacterium]|jgi:Ca2+:H+ antiporter